MPRESWWDGLPRRLPPSLARSANTIRRDFSAAAERYRAELYRIRPAAEADAAWVIFEQVFLS